MQILGSFERRHQPLISHRRFADRMLKVVGLWCLIAVGGLAVGMAGYATFEGMPGLLLIIATGFVLAPIFHRVLHHFHVETHKQD